MRKRKAFISAVQTPCRLCFRLCQPLGLQGPCWGQPWESMGSPGEQATVFSIIRGYQHAKGQETKQGPDALLNPLSPHSGLSQAGRVMWRQPQSWVFWWGSPTPAEALVQGTFSRVLLEEAKMNRASQRPSWEQVPGSLIRAFLYWRIYVLHLSEGVWSHSKITTGYISLETLRRFFK